MKTWTCVGLVFGLALLGPSSLFCTGVPLISTNAPPPADLQPAPQPPETAAVTVLPQPARAPENVKLSGWVGELVKLAEAGIEQDVLLSFIDGAGTFNLGAEQIVYLHDIGVSSQVITTIIQHDAEVASGVRLVTAAAPPSGLPRFQPAPEPISKPQTAAIPNMAELSDGEPDNTFYLEDFLSFDDFDGPQQPPELSPVRKPYAVQLTAPIVVFRAQGRIPNIMLLQTLP